MLDIRFYGKLRRLGDDPRPNGVSRREVPVGEGTTVRRLIRELGIAPEELGNIFLNNRLLLTCSPMNMWLNYLDARDRVPEGGTVWDTELVSGDRVALFGQDMGLLVV